MRSSSRGIRRTFAPAGLAGALLAASLTGCGAASRTTTAPVGPEPAVPAAADRGTLLVYSAYATSENGPNDPNYRRFHTPYRIYALDGKLVRTVPNHSGAMGDEPTPVLLPPGQYRVQARANGYGTVTVTVTLAPGRPTIIHLDGPVDVPL